MGQFALGIRSLLVRSTVFVIMAALLAWALGGTLFPRPSISDLTDRAVHFACDKWYWRVLVGGKNSGEIRWHLMREANGAEAQPFLETTFIDVEGPVICEDDGKMYIAGRDRASAKAWEIKSVDGDGKTQSWIMPDHLAALQQLVRLEKGLPLQDEATIAAQRFRVLDPLGN